MSHGAHQASRTCRLQGGPAGPPDGQMSCSCKPSACSAMEVGYCSRSPLFGTAPFRTTLDDTITQTTHCTANLSYLISLIQLSAKTLSESLIESPTTHPATGRGRGKAVKVYSAKGRRRHRTKVKPRRGVAEGKTPDPLELGRVVGNLTRGAGDVEEAVRAGRATGTRRREE